MPAVEHINAIKPLRPKTLIDVGANKGQFSIVARYLFPTAEIYGFEPIASEAARFQSVISGPVQLFDIALSSESGKKPFYIASKKDSSSLMKPTANQKKAYGTSLATLTEARTARLDDVLDCSLLPRPILLKIDVQGAELEVLKGGKQSISFFDFIYCDFNICICGLWKNH